MTSIIYHTDGKTFFPTPEPPASAPLRKLPLGTYSVTIHPKYGFGFARIDDMPVPTKIYGHTPQTADRILTTFAARPASTGVLLSGEKGSGKTLLGKVLSARLREANISTFVVNSPFCGEEFNDFIQSYQDPAMVLFDEFEKIYHERERQHQLLTLLDGSFPSKKLYVMTINEATTLNAMLMNRPGRLYYALKYGSLTDEEVREFAADNLKDKAQIEALSFACAGFQRLNFDMLAAIVQEMNRYNETPEQAMSMLNARIANEYDARVRYTLDVYNANGALCTQTHPPTWQGRPFDNGEKTVRVSFSDPALTFCIINDRQRPDFGEEVSETDDDFVKLAEQKKLKQIAGRNVELSFTVDEFDRAASVKGKYVFRKDGYSIVYSPPFSAGKYYD